MYPTQVLRPGQRKHSRCSLNMSGIGLCQRGRHFREWKRMRRRSRTFYPRKSLRVSGQSVVWVISFHDNRGTPLSVSYLHYLTSNNRVCGVIWLVHDVTLQVRSVETEVIKIIDISWKGWFNVLGILEFLPDNCIIQKRKDIIHNIDQMYGTGNLNFLIEIQIFARNLMKTFEEKFNSFIQAWHWWLKNK